MASVPAKAVEPEPMWEVAHLFPPRGQWDESDYLALDTNRLVELSDGCLEVLPFPTTSHQLLAGHLALLLQAFSESHALGTILFAPLPVRLWRGKFREPDVVFMLEEHADRIGEQFWKGADLVMEVVSGDAKDRERDLEQKRVDYARGRIPEYWIIDPQEERITVLRLAGKRYVVHGEFGKGKVASSYLLPGFGVDVTTAFAKAAARSGAKKARGRKT